MKLSLDAVSKDSRGGPLSNFSRVESRSSMPCWVGAFHAGLWWNCVVLLHPGGRAWLSLCLRRPRNVSRRARSLMSPILLTRCPSRLRAWTFRGCFGFDAEKPRIEDRISKRLRTLLEWAKKQERHAALEPRQRSQR